MKYYFGVNISMTEYISERANHLYKIYEKNISKTCIAFLNAMDGMGKETTIKSFLEMINHNNELEINPCKSSLPFAPLVYSLDFENTVEELFKLDKIKLQRCIKEVILKNLKIQSELIIICKDFDQFDQETAYFVFEIARFLINVNSQKTILFLITQNEAISFETRNHIKSLGRYTCYIDFPDWKSNDLKSLFNEVYPFSDISPECLNQIIDCSFKNAGIFLNNVEYLKERNYILCHDGTIKCHSLPNNILFGNYKDIIQSRYNQLEPNLKDALKKASIVGARFDAIILQNSFNLVMAAELMSEIEHISRLIAQINNSIYEFEFINLETHKMIESYIPEQKKDKWNMAIACYYENQLTDFSVCCSDIDFYEKAILAASYYEKSSKYDCVIAIYFKIIPILIIQGFFYKSLELIHNLNKIICIKEIPKRMLLQLYYWEYQCSFSLFDMKKGLQAFQRYRVNVNLQKNDAIYADYCEALMLYDSDHTSEAYKKIRKCYELLMGIDMKDRDNVRLKVQVTSLLCSIEETLLISASSAHFNEAAVLAKKNNLPDLYYSLLRRCGIVYSRDICIKLLRTAARYFCKKNKIEYAMTLHNLGEEQIFCDDRINSLKNLKKSFDIFLNKGHNGIVCVRNGLSIHTAIYTQHYENALDYIYDFATKYDEDFLVLTIYYNIITFLRKMGRVSEAKKFLNDFKKINNKPGNRYPYFTRFLYAQEGYFALEENQFQKAWKCFDSFFHHKYKDRVEYTLSVAITMAEISSKLGRELPHDIKVASKTTCKLASLLSKERLIFCEVLFWE